MSKYMNAFLSAGKGNMELNLEEEVSQLQLGIREHRLVRSNTTPGPSANIESLESWWKM